MYFQLTQTHFFVLASFGGLLLLVLMVLGYYSWRLHLSARHDRETLTDEEERDYPQGFKEENRPIPLLLILVAATVMLWSIGYAILVAIGVIDVS